MKKVIRLGDQTSHGGAVVSAAPKSVFFGKAVARIGDTVTCPINGHGPCTIIEGDPSWNIDGKPVALEGHKISCGAALISSMPQLGRAYEGMGAIQEGSAVSEALKAVAKSAPGLAAEFNQHVIFQDHEGKPISSLPYQIKGPDGAIVEGKTDASGKTHVVAGKSGDAMDYDITKQDK
ncbi:PAAR domain-containing protein [Iodobacter sp. HSC-16F04]|uniref:PAAR domain-containing protein n=1 Tax=Iodobacter violaceini TaxID=3044271 RepID=A0ABX0KZ15_9NEIS|nr:PAAR domain-containing protein [Iodobacter violacea]NHQ87712.1 PAAR domain-containing protein [Iodobacter violacea]